jgi:hypothetical protein
MRAMVDGRAREIIMRNDDLTIFPEARLIPKAGRWQLYVATYTFLLGLPLLVFPNAVIPLLGFAPTEEPWVRIAGMFLLGLTIISFGTFRSPTAGSIRGSIIVRIWFIVVLVALAAAGYPWSLYLIATIVLIGVIGSAHAYVTETRPSKSE